MFTSRDVECIVRAIQTATPTDAALGKETGKGTLHEGFHVAVQGKETGNDTLHDGLHDAAQGDETGKETSVDVEVASHLRVTEASGKA